VTDGDWGEVALPLLLKKKMISDINDFTSKWMTV
jgi:hypothetical protein